MESGGAAPGHLQEGLESKGMGEGGGLGGLNTRATGRAGRLAGRHVAELAETLPPHLKFTRSARTHARTRARTINPTVPFRG